MLALLSFVLDRLSRSVVRVRLRGEARMDATGWSGHRTADAFPSQASLKLTVPLIAYKRGVGEATLQAITVSELLEEGGSLFRLGGQSVQPSLPWSSGGRDRREFTVTAGIAIIATLPEGRRGEALAAHLDRAGKIKAKVTCLYLKPQFIRRWNRGLKKKEKTITVPVAVTLRQSLAEALP